MSYFDLVPCGRQNGAGTDGSEMPLYPMPMISPAGFPTGMPGGPAYNTPPSVPQLSPVPVAPGVMPAATTQMTPQSLASTQYTAGFLRSQIGRRVRVEFLIGTSTMTDRTGILENVGASYILLRDTETGETTMADLYAIKFVTFAPQGATTLPGTVRKVEGA